MSRTTRKTPTLPRSTSAAARPSAASTRSSQPLTRSKRCSRTWSALLGDEQYQVGKLSDFDGSFDKSYGAFKFLERPAPGNHEFYGYKDGEAGTNGSGYFDYFNGTTSRERSGRSVRPATSGEGWYSYDLGSWHIISLNIECNSPAFGNACDPTTGVLGQETSVAGERPGHTAAQCTLAYWHQPTFTSTNSPSAEGATADTWWKLLYNSGADVVLNGHEHVYARFKPQNPAGEVDTKHGLTQFTVGTGGEAARHPRPQQRRIVPEPERRHRAGRRVRRHEADAEPRLLRLGLPAGPRRSRQAVSALDYSDTGQRQVPRGTAAS